MLFVQDYVDFLEGYFKNAAKFGQGRNATKWTKPKYP